MGFWDKFKQVAEPAAKITAAVAPGPTRDIARLVERTIENRNDPNNLGALRALVNEIVALQERVAYLEKVVSSRQNR
jgi:hypothetical protein